MRRPLVVLSLLLAACTCNRRPPGAGGGSMPPTVRVAMEAEPPTLNPLVEHDAWTTWITLHGLYEPLLAQDPRDGTFGPALADRFTVEEARTYRFHLRPGVRWHDGRPFGAADVLATFELLRDPGVAAAQAADFADLRGVTVEGEEVVLRFAQAAPLALQALAHLPILPAHRFAGRPPGDLRQHPASRAPVGTGPFRLLAWRAGEAIVLERNPNYWGAAPLLARIELPLVRDREAAWELLQRGALDVVWRLTPAQGERPLPAGFRRHEFRLPSYSFVVWNLRRPGLGDRRVRQALTLLVDRRRYLEAAYRGRGEIVSGPYPLDSPSYDRGIAPWPHDPPRARRLLDEAGVIDRDGDGKRELEGRPLTIEFLYPAGSKTLEPLATLMQEDLRRAGLDLRAQPVEWAALLDRLRQHAFDAAALQWNMQPIQDNWFEFHSTEGEHGQNYGGFRHPEADRLLGALRRTAPGEARWGLDHGLHRLLHEEQPYTFLVCPTVQSVVHQRLDGYAPSVDGLGFAAWRWRAAP